MPQSLLNGFYLQDLLIEPTSGRVSGPGVEAHLKPKAVEVLLNLAGHATDTPASYSNAVVRIDADSGRVDRHAFPEHHIVEEPLHVQRPGGTDAGWLVGTLLDYGSGRTGVRVVDAGNLRAGPVAIATMERHMPLGFHGCFVPRTWRLYASEAASVPAPPPRWRAPAM